LRAISRDEAAILYKLYRHKVFGKHHLLEDNVMRGFPPVQIAALRGALDSLDQDGIVLRKSSKHSPAVYLPPKLGREVYQQLKRHYPFLPRPPWGD